MMEVFILVMAVVYGLFLLAAYRKGLSDGLNIAKGKEPEPVIKVKEKETKMPEIDARTEAIFRNIDNYDGTAAGQVKII